MFCRVLMNTAEKYLLNNYLSPLESIKINGYIGFKWVIPLLYIYVFISFYNGSWLCLIFTNISFSFGTYFMSTAIVQNKCWLCLLISRLHRIFVLFEIISLYLATVIVRGVFRALSNMMELFSKRVHWEQMG